VIAVLLGPPGVGKGTQATMLCDAHGWQHLSSGEVLRRTSHDSSDVGKQIQSIIATGALVPDAIMLRIIMDNIIKSAERGGVLLDGFPRTVAQATALDADLEIAGRRVDLALLLEADVEQLVARMPGRLTCRRCQAVYHSVHHPPRVEGTCDRCGGELYRRADDDELTVRHRMQVYDEQTQPLVEYYETRGVLERIDGSQAIDDVFATLDGVVIGAAVS